MGTIDIVMRVAERAFGGRGIGAIQDGRWSGLGLLPVVFDEFQRAVAAARRYEHLKRADAAALACDGISAADIPRRIFEEFYAIDDGRRCRAPSHIETWGVDD